jgi:hypothetical protein
VNTRPPSPGHQFPEVVYEFEAERMDRPVPKVIPPPREYSKTQNERTQKSEEFKVFILIVIISNGFFLMRTIIM